ncbi:L-fuculose-phosphate aldolase [Treponema brennaborense]|uniref:L-fuculose-phosphate aldolase n=1 Tax=Treponema brennaborense (strain DSM 12168 / CIP 105900 / DD5/3) TaxID=906968 RepID=F4LKP9_TREBD|nr:L-fuculose-phosphate aldolase [Treponema brennaborense]AEE15510.1 L-fuculose-phosphate aldolase [Treponema brennaborense DSM 12168]
MLLEKERMDVMHYCRKLVSAGLTKGTGGNISIYNRDQNLVAISPSGMDYFEVELTDIPVVSLDGAVVEGKRKPSSELKMHLIYYANREDISAVVHTHSPYCTVLATIREPLPASSYLVAFAGKNVRCTDYRQFGTEALADVAFDGMKDRNAVLLANHGLIAGGESIAHAFTVAEEIEFCAQIYVKSRAIGTPVILEDSEMISLIKKFKQYGQ